MSDKHSILDLRPLPEYDAFAKLTDALESAKDACLIVAEHRPDQRQQWAQIAANMTVLKEMVWRLAGTGMRGIKQ